MFPQTYRALGRLLLISTFVGCMNFPHISKADDSHTPAKVANSGSSTKEGFFILLKNEYGRHRTGNKIWLVVSYVNTTDKPIDLLIRPDFEAIEVKRDDGSPVKLTSGIRMGSTSGMRVEAYSCVRAYLLVSDTFDMNAPGKYEVVLTRFFENKKPHTDKSKLRELADGAAKSNKVTIEVVDEK